MNKDTIHAHALGVAITDADLAEIDLKIHEARATAAHFYGPIRYCPPPKAKLHRCHEDETELHPCECDAELHELSGGNRFLIIPITYRAIDFFIRRFPRQRTADGSFLICGRKQLGQTAVANLTYKVFRSNGQRFEGEQL
jgi:hypothetical protein